MYKQTEAAQGHNGQDSQQTTAETKQKDSEVVDAEFEDVN